MKLSCSAEALAQLRVTAGDNKVAVPGYDRAEVTAGIMHFGVGNFFRAHQAVFVDDLLNEGRDLDWGIVGANVVPQAEPHRRALMVYIFFSFARNERIKQ